VADPRDGEGEGQDRVSARVRRVSATAWYSAIWLSLSVLTYLAIATVISPKISHPVVTDGTGIIVIERSHDQQFYVEGAINGHPVTFLVDTGASLVSVSDEFARKIGLAAGARALFDTAGWDVATS
jgi:aspartyl protease family protein